MVAKVVGLTQHRRFLPKGHHFRRNIKAFRKGQVETDGPPPRLTPLQVWRRVKHFPKVTENGVTRIDGYGSGIIGQKEAFFGIFHIGKIIC